jgi:hypothetical protein
VVKGLFFNRVQGVRGNPAVIEGIQDALLVFAHPAKAGMAVPDAAEPGAEAAKSAAAVPFFVKKRLLHA